MNVGRRRVIMFTALPFTFAWILTVVADRVSLLLAASFSAGLCSAILVLASSIYISEIASPDIRGTLCSVIKITANVGLLVSYVLGTYLDWRQLALAAAMVPLLLFLLVRYIPESPSFLMYQGKEDLALRSLQWLRGPEAIFEPDLLDIRNSASRRNGRLCTRLPSGTLIKPILITCAIMFFQRFSGAFVLNYYAVTIFSSTFSTLDPHSVAILHGTVQLLASLVFGALVDRVGRVPLLVIGSLLITLSLGGLGCFVYVAAVSDTEIGLDWIPLMCVTVFNIAYSLGIGPIALLLVGELFPVEYRGLGGAVSTSFGHASGFVVVKTFVDFERLFHLSGTLWIYSTISLFGLLFILLFVPETKGQRLEDIQRRMELT